MMYYKIINERMVFSTCRTIELNGQWISNPSAEQISLAGWAQYIPPVVPPQPQTEPDYSQVMEAVKKMLSSDTETLTDEEALEVAAMFPTFVSKIGQSVPAGERLWWDGRLWKTLQNIPELLANWTPDTAVSLFVEVSIEEIPDWVQPSAGNAFMTGDKCKHNGHTWESIIDNNVWEPGTVGTENLWSQLD